MAASSSKYDATAVIAAANAKLAAGDWEGGQFLFQSSLLEWTDDAREGSGSSIPESLREAVATLWLAYAQFLIQAKQFKSATEAYEEAVNCSVAGSSGRVYAEYARFCVERNKRISAQNVYLKALVGANGGRGAVTDEQDRELLWNDFLDMMRTTKPELTMAALRKAVTEQAEAPSTKRRKLLGDDDDGSTASPVLATSLTESKTHVVTAESVEAQAASFADQLLSSQHYSNSAAPHFGLPPDVAAAWMSRDGHGQPQAPEPPLFHPSPPKLSDPTAKDILGTALAIHLVQRLLSPSGGIILEVCRALWMLQALKEHSNRESLAALDTSLLSQHERLESELDARLSVAGAVSGAVAQMNERERHSFQQQANQQRQQVLSQAAWDMRQLLCWQQQALAKLDVPAFEEGPTVDAETLQLQSRICQYLHSAFYIRNRMGSEPHETMLRSQLKKLLREQEGGTGGSRSPKRSASSPAPVVARHSPIPPPLYANTSSNMMQMQMPMQPQYNVYPPPLPQQQPQLQPMMGLPPPPQQLQQQQLQQHAYTQQQGMMYGQQQPMMMMMMQPQQQPYLLQQQQQMQQQQLQLPPLPPNQPQPPPYPGGPPQYPYYQQ